VNISRSEDNTQQSSSTLGGSDHAQGHINEYFDTNAPYWDGVYSGQDLQGRIYQRRQDAVLAYVDDAMLRPHSAALEIGCGAGHLTAKLAERGFLVDAVDSSEAMVGATAARVLETGLDEAVTVGQADVHALPFPPDHFDLVVAVGVIPWLHSPETAVAEMARVTRPGGHLIITADNRARLSSFTDPRRMLGLSPLKRAYRALRKPRRPGMSQLHWPRRVDGMVDSAGLRTLAHRTVGFGPLSFLGRWSLEGPLGTRLDARLQALADRGVPGLRVTGWHYLVHARKA
jgi:SAM-dependent methyltransferase